MLIALSFIAFGAMVASWLFVPEKDTVKAEQTSMVPSAAAAD
jgi:hypothetical protein